MATAKWNFTNHLANSGLISDTEIVFDCSLQKLSRDHLVQKSHPTSGAPHGGPNGMPMIEFGVWPKILRGSCLILRAMWIQASLWAVYQGIQISFILGTVPSVATLQMCVTFQNVCHSVCHFVCHFLRFGDIWHTLPNRDPKWSKRPPIPVDYPVLTENTTRIR